MQSSPDLVSISPEAAPADAYVSGYVYIRNDHLLTEDFIAAHKVKHIYVTASFDHQEAGKVSIPLYHLDLENPSSGFSNGMKLISNIPFHPDSDNQISFTIETRALGESQLETFLEVYEAAEDFIDMVPVTDSSGLAAGLKAVSLLTSKLKNYSSREYHFRAVIAVEELQRKSYTHFQVLYPTEDNRSLTEEATAERKRLKELRAQRKLKACAPSGSTKETYLCAADKDYETFPYIAVRFELSDYKSQFDLLPNPIGSQCSEVTDRAVADARAKLERSNLFSATQKAMERDLLKRAELYLAIKGAVDGGDAVRALDLYGSPPDAHDESPLYKARYQARHDQLEGCIVREGGKVAGLRWHQRVVDLNDAFAKADANLTQFEVAADFLNQLRQHLGAIAYGERSYLAKTRSFGQATVNAMYAENALWENHFRADVTFLLAQKQGSEEAEKRIEVLRKKQLSALSCEVCNAKVTEAVSRYREISNKAELAQLEWQRGELLKLGRIKNGFLEYRIVELEEKIAKEGDAAAHSTLTAELEAAEQTLAEAERLAKAYGEADNPAAIKKARDEYQKFLDDR